MGQKPQFVLLCTPTALKSAVVQYYIIVLLFEAVKQALLHCYAEKPNSQKLDKEITT